MDGTRTGPMQSGPGELEDLETSVAELAALTGAHIEGDANTRVTGVGSVDDAEPGDVVLAANPRFLALALKSSAACVVSGELPEIKQNGHKSLLLASDPAEAFSKILEYFRGEDPKVEPGIGAGAVVERGAELGTGVAIGSNCYVGKNAVVGSGTVLYPGVYVGEGARVGADCKLCPNSVVYSRCVLGNRVILHAGAVVGADGFGYTCKGEGLVKLPHAGTVEIGDDVEIGANSAIDRAKTGATVIGSGTKIDNLVHIAHNCKIGRNCVIVALVGVAGSVKIGDNVTLAGQAGVADHVTIEDGCVVAARAGVIGDLSKSSVVSGFPARDHRLEKRVQAARLHLPEMLQRLNALEAEVERLRASGEGGK